MKADPLAAHRTVESLTGEGFLRRELALALKVKDRHQPTKKRREEREREKRKEKKKKTQIRNLGSTSTRDTLLA